MRAFFGIPVPESLRDPLADLQEELAGATDLKRVDPDNFHLTVRFLGEISQSDLEDIDSHLQSRLPTPGPLTLTLSGVGVFPNVERPSVAWSGINLTDDLNEVYESVESIARELDFEPDDHDFHPHVTLGRYKDKVEDKNRLLEWIRSHGEETIGDFEAEHLHLYESELQQDGPIYTSLVSWPL